MEKLIENLGQLINYVEENQAPKTSVIDGRPYSLRNLYQVAPNKYQCLNVESLVSLVSYIKEVNDVAAEKFIININGPRDVEVLMEFNETTTRRETVLVANSEDYSPTLYHATSLEEALIQLKSRFVQTDDRDAIIRALGNVKKDESVEVGDDGFTQTIATKKGIDFVKDKLPPTVELKPYRTFSEVDQPASHFVLRVSNDFSVKLIEADGGTWRLDAFDNIRKYLIKQLKDGIEAGTVVIL